MVDRTKFEDALEAYVVARIAQDKWDEIAPTGLSASQRKRENRLHAESARREKALLAVVFGAQTPEQSPEVGTPTAETSKETQPE